MSGKLYETTTTPLGDGRIQQEETIMGQMTRRILDTREEHVRQALIQLGWTPPADAVIASKADRVRNSVVSGLTGIVSAGRAGTVVTAIGMAGHVICDADEVPMPKRLTPALLKAAWRAYNASRAGDLEADRMADAYAELRLQYAIDRSEPGS